MFPADAGYLPPLPSFPIAVDPPAVDPDEGTQQAFCFAEEWRPYVLAALAALTLPTTWVGDEADVLLAQQRAGLLLALVGNPPEGCGTGGDCPYDIRYDEETGQVQVSTDGGETWEQADYLDPRKINQFPPPSTVDPRCDAAARMSAAMNALFDALSNALSGGAVAADLGGIIMAWLALFAGFAVLVALAVAIGSALLSIGATDVATAYNAMDWDDFQCELLCSIGADGFITEAGLTQFQTEYISTLTATQQNVINLILSITGIGALNGFAATGGETGDCSECAACGWSHTLYADSPELDWFFPYQYNLACNNTTEGWYGKHGATESNGAGHLRWIDTPRVAAAYWLGLAGVLHIPTGCTVTSFVLNAFLVVGNNLDGWHKTRKFANSIQCWDQFYSGFNSWTGSISGPVEIPWEINWNNVSNNGYRVRVNSITVSGTGVDPFLV